MTMSHLEPTDLEKLRRLGSCSVANAIETIWRAAAQFGIYRFHGSLYFPGISALGGLRGHGAYSDFRTTHGGGELLLPARLARSPIKHSRPADPCPAGHGPASGAGLIHRGCSCEHPSRAWDASGVVTNGAVRNVDEVRVAHVSNVCGKRIGFARVCPCLRFRDPRRSGSHAGSAGRPAPRGPPRNSNYPNGNCS